MGRKRKGVEPESNRHIRRLAERSAAIEIQNLSSSSACSSNAIDVNVQQVVEPNNKFTMEPDKLTESNKLTSVDLSSECHSPVLHVDSDLQYDIEGLFPMQVDVDNLESLQNEKENYTAVSDDDTDNNSSRDSNDDNFENNDDSLSTCSSETYRYSDSEAESIPELIDENNEVYFDNEYVLQNPADVRNEPFRSELANWAKNFKISHNALKELLVILNKYSKTTFPKDPRTLLKTPTITKVSTMEDGEYCHLGLINAVKKIIESRLSLNHEFVTVNLFINIDGAPIAGNSSEKGLWLILCKDEKLDCVHPVGIYYGAKKPADQNNLLKMFVDEASQVLSNQFPYREKLYNINIYGFIFDAPAKSYILCTKYHSGYSSCSKCLINGKHYSSVAFPSSTRKDLNDYCNKKLRTDSAFKNYEYIDDYQHGETILKDLPRIGLVSDVPLDAMHLVYLGVMKQLIRHWLGDKGRKNKAYKLSSEVIKKISDRLEQLKFVLPSDFNRRCRSLKYWKLWKATEYRHFLLYLGPIVLKNTLKPEVYKHFLYLSCSIQILSNKLLIREQSNVLIAEKLLIEFVFTFQKIYGKDNVTFNVHNLIHLSKDVLKYGPLESFSAFPFENYICSIKKMIRKGEKVLQQIARRIKEYESLKNMERIINPKKKFETGKIHYNGVIAKNHVYDTQYKILSINHITKFVINDTRNSYVLLRDGTIVNILNFGEREGLLYIIGKIYTFQRALYSLEHFSSDTLLIGFIKETKVIKDWPYDMIHAKLFHVLTSLGIIVCPILHSYLPFEGVQV